MKVSEIFFVAGWTCLAIGLYHSPLKFRWEEYIVSGVLFMIIGFCSIFISAYWKKKGG